MVHARTPCPDASGRFPRAGPDRLQHRPRRTPVQGRTCVDANPGHTTIDGHALVAARKRQTAAGWRAVLVVLVALVAGAIGASGAYAFHWQVIQPSDTELLAVAPELTPPGFVVDWGPDVSGKWAPSLDRGYVEMDVSSDDLVTIETIAADLVGAGWVTHPVSTGNHIDQLSATKDGLWLNVSRSTGRGGIGSKPTKSEEGTSVEFTVERDTQTPSLTTTVWLGTLLAAGLGGAISIWLTRRRN